MKVSDKAVAMIKHHEGVRQKPYRCPANLWTIGVGHVLYPEQARLKMDERMLVPLRPEDNRIFSMEEVDAILNQIWLGLNEGWNNTAQLNLHKVSLMLLSVFLLMWVWELYSEAHFVKKLIDKILKVLRLSF